MHADSQNTRGQPVQCTDASAVCGRLGDNSVDEGVCVGVVDGAGEGDISGTEVRDGDSRGWGRATATFNMESLTCTCTRGFGAESATGREGGTGLRSPDRGEGSGNSDCIGCDIAATTERADTLAGAGAFTRRGCDGTDETVVAGAGNTDKSSSCSSNCGVAGMYTVGDALVGRAGAGEATGTGRFEKLAGKKPRGCDGGAGGCSAGRFGDNRKCAGMWRGERGLRTRSVETGATSASVLTPYLCRADVRAVSNSALLNCWDDDRRGRIR